MMIFSSMVQVGWAQAPAAEAADHNRSHRKNLHVVSDDNFPPYLFKDTEGNVRGYTADLWKLYEKATGVQVTLTATNWENAQRMIQNREADAIDLIYRTASRESLYEFSKPYMSSSSAIFSHSSIGGITGVTTLKGFRIGVQAGDACIELLEENEIIDIQTYKNYTEMINAAKQNEIKVFCMDEFPASFYLYKLQAQKEFKQSFILYTGYFHWATISGESNKLLEIEKGMKSLDPKDLEEIKKKWLDSKFVIEPRLEYIRWAIIGLLALGISLGLWNLALRKMVAAKTDSLKSAMTDLKQAHQASEHVVEQLTATLNAIPDLLFKLDSSGLYLEVFTKNNNDLAAPIDELVGKNIHDILPAEAVNVIMDSIRNATISRSDHGRVICLSINGIEKWFEFSTTANTHKSDDSLYFLVLSRDITQRRQAERELIRLREEALNQEKERQFRQLFDSAPVALAYLTGTTIESVNAQFVKLFGYDQAELSTIDDWWPRAFPDPVVRAAAENRWATALEESIDKFGIIAPQEYSITTKNGCQLTMLIGGQALVDGVIVTLIDVTKLKHVEEELISARMIAQNANKAKSIFLANMSHEIRTPMNAILGMAHQMRRTGLPKDQAIRLDKLDSAAMHLLRLISDILDITKIESGKLSLEYVPFNFMKMLDNIQSLVSNRVDEKGLLLTIVAENLPECFVGDETRLQQCVLNYLSNAIKFTEVGHITLKVSSLEQNSESALVKFEVEDTGIGIRADVLPRLFGSFEQADVYTTRRYGGSGLGLSITKHLVELMNGTTGVNSTPSVGSIFWFTANLAICSDTVVVQTDVDIEDAENVIKREFRGSRVLVVDDEPINQEVLAFLLRDAGLIVDLANGGGDAISMAEHSSYSAILMDMQMPGVDGLAATQQIRQITIHRVTPIIAMTANAFADDRALCLNAGMGDFLTKPVIPGKLFAALLNAFRLRHSYC